ncbi:MAG: membrane-bound O-acyltransferase family protein [Anaerolineaceae bacterium 4572_78]|nr:MAG: membrane-bound O-acyltransferase family protein [Anaerolineaceae bacterium 4572_78]
MLFNSLTFIIFFIITYTLYLLLYRKTGWQNALILIASYIFYGYWDWRFLTLIIISTLVDFLIGLRLGRTEDEHARKRLLAISLIVNLSILGFFKYFNFFSDNFTDILNLVGMEADPITLNIILPVGISFYTLQTISYTFDIYRRKMQPTKNLLEFAVFVAFFPQLMAGPIERAINLLPQIAHPRQITSSQVHIGLYLILMGYFKKVVVADNVATIANQVFNHYTWYTDLDIFLAVMAFLFQLYGDFSGYSDIARGLAKLMGFELMVNFKLPFFALTPADYWERWHISLSSWMRDYLFIPLGGSRGSKWMTIRNLFIIMVIGGLWHGAGLNFIVWGIYDGFILGIYLFFRDMTFPLNIPTRKFKFIILPLQMFAMFSTNFFRSLLFRVTSTDQFDRMLRTVSFIPTEHSSDFISTLLFFITPLILMEIYQYFKHDLLAIMKLPIILRNLIYAFMIYWIFLYGVQESVEFFYFQF